MGRNPSLPLSPVRINAGRTITGILRGFDPYMNLVLDDCVEERSIKDKYNIGLVVSIVSNTIDHHLFLLLV